MRETDFWRITLDTNPDTCNLNCVMCEDHSPYSDSPKLRKQQGRLRPNMDRLMLEQVIRDEAGAAFCFGRQIWRGEMAEFTARTIVGGKR